MRPVAWSSSYLFRWPFGISIVTSNCTAVVWPTVTPSVRRRVLQGVGSIASSGSTVVTANYSRFRRRLVIGVLALLLVIAAVVATVVVVTRSGSASPAVEAAAAAQLPEIGEPAPVLAGLSSDAPAPD